ncbi:MAG: ribose 5-phosphate isomerase B [Clostridia bacterium]|nr:ribose 5-phosphate isomerase B [Clostridia bacterium]
MKIAIANDHAGVECKKALCEYISQMGHEVVNFGTDQLSSCDYPDYAKAVANEVASGRAQRGILICGTGVGMSIAANKVKGIRASLCDSTFIAEMTRKHNDSNVLCMGQRVTSLDTMKQIVEVYLNTPFDEENCPGRHTARINKIEN